jgi:uncharacterized membrane protein YgcG
MAIIALVIAAVLGAACSKTPTSPTSNPAPPVATTTRLSFTGDATSYVAQAQSRTYTLQNATFGPMVGHDGRYVSVVVRPTDPADTSGVWSLVMMGHFGQQLSQGTYSFGEVSGTAPFFSFGGGGRSCGSGTTASFTIHDIAISGETLQRLRMSFILYCGGSATVRGELVVLADPWR